MSSSPDGAGDRIEDLDRLDDLLSEPTEEVIETLGRLDGDIVLLGAGGKMGPSLSRMARRASEAAGVRRRVIAVSRFSASGLREDLERHGIETIACDLLEPAEVARLPDAPNVVYMAGRKFGTQGAEPLTWAMNVIAPAIAARRYAGSRMVAFSSGNVYGLVPVSRHGSREDDPTRPSGEYAMSVLGRERVLEHSSRALGIPMAVIRLNYAVEMRYGVLVDLAQRVLAGEPIDLSMGHANVIWQGDANAATLRAFDHPATPPRIINVAGPEVLSVRQVCTELGRLLGAPVRFTGAEAPDALLSDGSLGRRLLGEPRVGADRLVRWTADWMRRGGIVHGLPTHFEVRDGSF